MKKNFEIFQEFYNSLKFKFSIIFFSETWTDDDDLNKNSNFQLKGYDFVIGYIREGFALLYTMKRYYNNININHETLNIFLSEFLTVPPIKSS